MVPNENAAQKPAAARAVQELGGVTLTRTLMWSGRSKYVVTGTLDAGVGLELVDASGFVYGHDMNTSTDPRPVALGPVMSADHALALTRSALAALA